MEPGSWSLELGPWNLDSRVWSLESGVWSLELGTWNLESRALEPGAWREPGAWGKKSHLNRLQGASWNLLPSGLWCRRGQEGLQEEPKGVHRLLHLLRGWELKQNLARAKEDWREPLENLRRTQKLQGASRSLLLSRLRCWRDQEGLQDDPKEVHRRLHLLKGWNPEWNLAWPEEGQGQPLEKLRKTPIHLHLR